MVNPRLYLETTVLSAYFDDRALDRQRSKQQFWEERLPDFEGLGPSTLSSVSGSPTIRSL